MDMSVVNNSLWEGIHDFVFNPDFENKMIVQSNVLTPSICLGYYLITTYIGPHLMKDRRPFNVTNMIIAYNALMVVLNSYVAYALIAFFLRERFEEYSCPADPYQQYKKALKALKPYIWMFNILKYIEFTDSVFFILRKRFDLLTVLHRIHHAAVPIIGLVFMRYSLTTCAFFGALMNSTIHVIMYFYYGLAACGPKFKQYLWWKKYLTAIQISQFVANIVCTVINVVTGCYPTQLPEIVTLCASGVLLILFCNYFFRQLIKIRKWSKVTNGTAELLHYSRIPQDFDMSVANNSVWEGIHDFVFNTDYEDKMIVRSNVLAPSICLIYYMVITYVGPYLMKDRKPFKVRNVIIFYNALMVVFNFYVALGFISLMRMHGIQRYMCPADPYKQFTTARKILKPYIWTFLMLKYVEFMDSIFFIMRKKFDLLTVLHRVHHASVPALALIFLRNSLSTCAYFAVIFNAIIHVIMYFYYGLAACGPKFRKYLWWKKYLTTMQITQFVANMICTATNAITGCYPTKEPEIVTLVVSGVMFILFLNYFIHQIFKKRMGTHQKEH